MPGFFELHVKSHFSAAHSLKGYQGDCAQLHGHNWTVEVFVKSKKLNDIGMAIDFKDIKETVNEVLAHLDHTNLNELPAFREVNPTCENIARFIYQELGRRFHSDYGKVTKVYVSENSRTGASYWEE